MIGAENESEYLQCNWVNCYSSFRNNFVILYYPKRNHICNKKECPSVMPFVGGASGAVAILFILQKQYWGLAFIPPIIDYGSTPTIIRFIYYFISDWVIEKNKGD